MSKPVEPLPAHRCAEPIWNIIILSSFYCLGTPRVTPPIPPQGVGSVSFPLEEEEFRNVDLEFAQAP